MVSKKIEAPKINTFSVKPSLYKTRTKLRKTKAVPVSFWMVISSNGIRTKPKHNIVFEKLNFLILNKLMYLASANDVANFANSEGWILKLPNSNQESEPLVIFPTNKIRIKLLILRAYIKKDNEKKNFQSIIITKNAIKDDIKINKSCLPCLFDRLKISFESSLNSDAYILKKPIKTSAKYNIIDK